MKGLLLKDFYMAWRYCRILLVLVVVFICFILGRSGKSVFSPLSHHPGQHDSRHPLGLRRAGPMDGVQRHLALYPGPAGQCQVPGGGCVSAVGHFFSPWRLPWCGWE